MRNHPARITRPSSLAPLRVLGAAGLAATLALSLAACKDAIDELKERVPLWKKDAYAGGEEWIGRGS